MVDPTRSLLKTAMAAYARRIGNICLNDRVATRAWRVSRALQECAFKATFSAIGKNPILKSAGNVKNAALGPTFSGQKHDPLVVNWRSKI